MSRATPRKPRHRRDASGGAGATAAAGNSSGHGPRTVPTSDYESDAAQYMETRKAPTQAATATLPRIERTNTDINLGVLQRYLPSIRDIACMAANAVVYTFSPATHEWDKANAEGTMFVCDQESAPASGLPRSCVFLLNRRSLENVMIDLGAVSVFEVNNELLIFQMGEKVIGLWIHADQEDTRTKNATEIQQRWAQVRAAATAAEAGGAAAEPMGPAMQALGRKLSISDLFGRASEAHQDNGA